MLALYAPEARKAQLAAVGRSARRQLSDSSSAHDAGVGQLDSPKPSGEAEVTKSAPTRKPWRAGAEDQEIHVLIVDDHPGVRSAIEALIARTPGLRVVGSVSSGAAAIEGVRRLQPTVVIMDLGMPGINGVEATARFAGARRRP